MYRIYCDIYSNETLGWSRTEDGAEKKMRDITTNELGTGIDPTLDYEFISTT